MFPPGRSPKLIQVSGSHLVMVNQSAYFDFWPFCLHVQKGAKLPAGVIEHAIEDHLEALPMRLGDEIQQDLVGFRPFPGRRVFVEFSAQLGVSPAEPKSSSTWR